MASKGSSENKEDGITIAMIALGVLGVMILLLWLSSSTKIVNFWTPKLVILGKAWLWLPGEFGAARFQEVGQTAALFLREPSKVSLPQWVGFFNKAAWVPSIAANLGVTLLLVRVILKRRPKVRRTFKPQHLAEHLSHVFTGTAPVLHLRKALAADKEPFWRRQTFPHEVLLNEKVDGKPLVTDGKMDEGRARTYFVGVTPTVLNGRMVSTMLGRQVVNLLTDRGKSPCYADRFSHTGKVIYALLCAHAFGGEEGKRDYAKARDQLNNSARGAAHGFANLTVAQWLYDKYRNNPTAKKLFAIHHWEYTFLYELLVQAKRQGKCGHWEFMWLKPMNRILFYVMNTVGRLTPHTESASAFSQYVYERRVAKRGRLPLKVLETGAHAHVIYVEKAVKALGLEWERWRDGEDDDNEWWKDEEIWNRLSGIRLDAPAPPPPALSQETSFDRMMSSQADEQAKREQSERSARVAAASAGDNEINW